MNHAQTSVGNIQKKMIVFYLQVELLLEWERILTLLYKAHTKNFINLHQKQINLTATTAQRSINMTQFVMVFWSHL